MNGPVTQVLRGEREREGSSNFASIQNPIGQGGNEIACIALANVWFYYVSISEEQEHNRDLISFTWSPLTYSLTPLFF